MGMVEVDHKRKSDNRLSTGRSNQSCPAAHAQVTPALIFLPILVSCALACVQQAVLVTPLVSIPSAGGPRGDTAPLLPSGEEAVPLQPALMLGHEILTDDLSAHLLRLAGMVVGGTGGVSGHSHGIPFLLKHRC